MQPRRLPSQDKGLHQQILKVRAPRPPRQDLNDAVAAYLDGARRKDIRRDYGVHPSTLGRELARRNAPRKSARKGYVLRFETCCYSGCDVKLTRSGRKYCCRAQWVAAIREAHQ